MITVRISAENGAISAVSCEGHSGYAESGSDIVCAAVTGAMRFVSAMLDDVLGLAAEAEIDDKRAFIRISCGAPAAAPVFRGFELLMREYQSEYPEFIRVV